MLTSSPLFLFHYHCDAGPDSPVTPRTMPYFIPIATNIIRGCGHALDAASFHFYNFFSWELGKPDVSSLSSGNLSHLWNQTYLK
jgi:hypothetical protein